MKSIIIRNYANHSRPSGRIRTRVKHGTMSSLRNLTSQGKFTSYVNTCSGSGRKWSRTGLHCHTYSTSGVETWGF